MVLRTSWRTVMREGHQYCQRLFPGHAKKMSTKSLQRLAIFKAINVPSQRSGHEHPVILANRHICCEAQDDKGLPKSIGVAPLNTYRFSAALSPHGIVHGIVGIVNVGRNLLTQV